VDNIAIKLANELQFANIFKHYSLKNRWKRIVILIGWLVKYWAKIVDEFCKFALEKCQFIGF
jgi:hypothetical protein